MNPKQTVTPPSGEPTPREIGKRWTPKLVKDGWTPIANLFIEHYADLNLSTPEAMLVIQLMRHKWGAEAPYPGFKTLAKRMGISMTAARGHARKLERKGYLRRVKRVGETNEFDLSPLFAALEKKQREEKQRSRQRGGLAE